MNVQSNRNPSSKYERGIKYGESEIIQNVAPIRLHGLTNDRTLKGKSNETVLSEGVRGAVIMVTSTRGPGGCKFSHSLAEINGPEIRRMIAKITRSKRIVFPTW